MRASTQQRTLTRPAPPYQLLVSLDIHAQTTGEGVPLVADSYNRFNSMPQLRPQQPNRSGSLGSVVWIAILHCPIFLLFISYRNCLQVEYYGLTHLNKSHIYGTMLCDNPQPVSVLFVVCRLCCFYLSPLAFGLPSTVPG